MFTGSHCSGHICPWATAPRVVVTSPGPVGRSSWGVSSARSPVFVRQEFHNMGGQYLHLQKQKRGRLGETTSRYVFFPPQVYRNVLLKTNIKFQLLWYVVNWLMVQVLRETWNDGKVSLAASRASCWLITLHFCPLYSFLRSTHAIDIQTHSSHACEMRQRGNFWKGRMYIHTKEIQFLCFTCVCTYDINTVKLPRYYRYFQNAPNYSGHYRVPISIWS